ncbi:aromatic prenyltransferase [Lepidopterella palustris CBS 459.81]|uniref:Aromatic prenyltransferase n=1 Tax=Lepidopterella palustris CBS 459.81 TaxID=1314670 RepID=A0A8E2JCZ3_9PEZI|nr:aromatic prenyltransferase [Lepidopterella palustris CBS 459.81]
MTEVLPTENGSGAALRIVNNQPQAWQAASRYPFETEEAGPWWQLVGPHLATLTHEAKYSVERQLEVLMFLQSHVLPRLGDAPSPDAFAHWKSLLTNDGSPLEYSWKWNSKDGNPEIRYCIEAIGSQAGKSEDPVNYFETEKLLLQLAPVLPGLDLTWFEHFTKAFDMHRETNTNGKPEGPRTSMFIAFEHLDDRVVVKTYFLPSEDGRGSPPTFATFANAARTLSSNTKALEEVLKYVSSDPHGSTLIPDMLAIDCIEPSKSRLKLYVGSTHTSFESIISVMTLGGKIKNVENGIDQLRELFGLVLGLKKDFSWSDDTLVQDPFDANLAHPFDLYRNMTYYFDIAPGSALPDVKFYIPVIRYAKSDNDVAAGLARFLRLHGRGQFVDGFLTSLEKIRERHAAHSGHRIQTFIAAAFQKDGSLALTSYMNPGIYHSQIKARERAGHMSGYTRISHRNPYHFAQLRRHNGVN